MSALDLAKYLTTCNITVMAFQEGVLSEYSQVDITPELYVQVSNDADQSYRVVRECPNHTSQFYPIRNVLEDILVDIEQARMDHEREKATV